MYSDKVPPIVMPNTNEGRHEASYKFPGIRVGFCDQYRRDYYNSRMCENRQMEGVRSKNWCLRCPCGFIALYLSEKDQEATRLGALSLNGW